MSDDPQFRDPDDRERREPTNPFAPGGPFGAGGFDLSKIDLNEMVRMLQSDGPVNWEVARQMATFVALDGAERDEPIAPSDHEQLEELTRAAQTHVLSATGLTAAFAATVRSLGRAEWARLHLDVLAPVLEALARTLREAIVDESEELEAETPGGPEAPVMGPFGIPMDPGAMAGLMGMMAPMLLGVQAGSMVGYLAQHALGRYDLPLPTSDSPSVCFVVANLDAFESAWSLPRADLRFVVVLHEVVRAAERSVPWVQERLVRLATEYVTAYELDAATLEAQLGEFDPNDPQALSGIAEHPEALLGAMRSPGQDDALDQLQAFTSVLEGYAEVVVEGVGESLVPSFAQVHEALQRHRVDRGEAGRFVEGLLGLHYDRTRSEQGQAFCRGVVERAGLDGLNRLWEGEGMLPTVAELAAPGLWLARIELP